MAPADQVAQTNPFRLAKTVAKEVKKCARGHGSQAKQVPPIDYLWINIAAKALEEDGRPCPADRMLDRDNWLNVVDEVAALGVRFMVVCVGDCVGTHPEVWDIVRWATEVHGITVGIHSHCGCLDPEEVEALKQLDQERTWLFVSKENTSLQEQLSGQDINVCEAEVCAADHSPPCDIPETMVYVGPDGLLYTCGLVLGDDAFKLGSVFESSVAQVMSDESLPHNIPPSARRNRHGCDACPPLMVKRMARETGQELPGHDS